MKFRSLGVCALALFLPLAAVACGGEDDTNSGSRPSVEEIKKDISAVIGVDASQPGVSEIIDCLAKGYHDSELPNGVLRKIVKGEDAEVDKKNEDKYNKISTDIQAECTGSAMPAE